VKVATLLVFETAWSGFLATALGLCLGQGFTLALGWFPKLDNSLVIGGVVWPPEWVVIPCLSLLVSLGWRFCRQRVLAGSAFWNFCSAARLSALPNLEVLMKSFFIAIAAFVLGVSVSVAQPAHSAKEVKEDVARHRAMAAAHEAAAKCLESGKKEDVCTKELQAACKGLAIGKFCGMKHEH
jgi:hypothetical protein